MAYTRYAVYVTPPPGAFAETAARWLGWDIAAGAPVPQESAAQVALTDTPRKYGFHATIKPPMRLSEGCDAAGLSAAFETHCARTAPVVLEGLEVTALGRFLALTPRGDTTALGALAAQTVEALDSFRAPAPEDELARRRAAGLSPAQEENLLRWGYPYVMDQFRYHMTLTGKLPRKELPAQIEAARTTFAPVLPRPFVIDALTLAGEDENGRFHALTRVPLGG